MKRTEIIDCGEECGKLCTKGIRGVEETVDV
jgi:hypothetical protein